MSDTADIEQYCKDKGIMFVEDAAQSLGSRINNRKAGSIGDCSSFSFNTNKVISGINGGGIFLTDNEQLANTVKKLRRHGKGKDYEMLDPIKNVCAECTNNPTAIKTFDT